MVFRCQLVNRNIFTSNHRKVAELISTKRSDFKTVLFLERDTTYDKCKHAIKVIAQCNSTAEPEPELLADYFDSPKIGQYTLGYLPTDVSFNLAILMDENRGYFILSALFSESTNTTQTEVHLDLEESILRDKKVKDDDFVSKEEREGSPCYSLKSLWGIPKQF